MKLAPLLLAGSLVANVALFLALAWQPALAPPVLRDFFRRNFHPADDSAGAAPKSHAAPSAADARPLWNALKSDDPATLIARLRAAGFPPSVIRDLARIQVNARYNSRLAALLDPDPNLPYWKTSPAGSPADSKRQEEINQLQRERAKVLRDLVNDDFFATGDVSAAQRRQFGDLSRPKIDAVQRIEDDYNEMFSQVRATMNGITFPEDREKLALLNREKQADLAAVLSPEELADYNVRSSPITSLLRNQLGLFDASESEFRAIFQMQQSLNDKFPPSIAGGMVSSGDYQQRQAAQQELEAQLKTTLGDARYAEYQRDTNRDFQQLTRLAQRDNLPGETVITAFNLRDQIAQNSNRIFDDAAMSNDQKRAALQTLAQDARAQILATLGPTSGPAYVKVADTWLNNVERGSAVSFNSATGGMTSMTNNNGQVAMVSIGSGGTSYRRLPGSTPPPARDTIIISPGR